MSNVVFYGLDEAGEIVQTEPLARVETTVLTAMARERLKDFASVEIWDGPLCIVRLRRRAQEEA